MESIQLLVEMLIPIMGAVLMGLVPVFVLVIGHYIKQWTGVQITERQRIMLEDIALDAVSYAEEQARNAIANNVKPSPTVKMKWAVDFVNEELQEWNIPQMTTSVITSLIEAKLNNIRPEEGHKCKSSDDLPQ